MAERPDMLSTNAGGSSKALPVGRFRTLRDVNERNRLFSEERSRLMEQRMSDEAVIRVAMNDVQSEASGRMPIRYQKSFEQALEAAEKARVLFRSAFSKKGGAALKTDALQELILRIVRKNPSVTEGQLLRHLRRENLGEVVTDIDHKHVRFSGRGMEKKASIRGLKDRLSRAKKKIRNEKEFDSR